MDVDGGVVSFPIISNGIEANYSMDKIDRDDFLSLNDAFFQAQLGNYDDHHHIFNGLTLILTIIIKVLSEKFAHCY